jgi:hypothetical protein
MSQKSRLESEGAEFLVLGQLLIECIDSYKNYRNAPGYDLVAVSPEQDRTARIQVKSRWRTKASGFLIKNLDCDFVVFVKLNRGLSYDDHSERKSPEFFVFPIEAIKRVHEKGRMPKVRLSKIGNLDSFRENWTLIREFVSAPVRKR